jgi:CRP/FNR family transcriptional regulator
MRFRTRLEPLLADAVRLTVPAGSLVRREGEPGPHVELVITGLVRVLVSSPDGRTATMRYCRPGALIGVVSLFQPDYVMLGSLQALVDTLLLVFRADTMRTMADQQRAMASALLGVPSERVFRFVAELPGASFASVRQRIAASSSTSPPTGSMGRCSSRRSASRPSRRRRQRSRGGRPVLGELRREGLVATGAGGIKILDPDRLAAEVFAGPVTDVPLATDTGR